MMVRRSTRSLASKATYSSVPLGGLVSAAALSGVLRCWANRSAMFPPEIVLGHCPLRRVHILPGLVQLRDLARDAVRVAGGRNRRSHRAVVPDQPDLRPGFRVVDGVHGLFLYLIGDRVDFR